LVHDSFLLGTLFSGKGQNDLNIGIPPRHPVVDIAKLLAARTIFLRRILGTRSSLPALLLVSPQEFLLAQSCLSGSFFKHLRSDFLGDADHWQKDGRQDEDKPPNPKRSAKKRANKVFGYHMRALPGPETNKGSTGLGAA
jgi:hypothetical protein